MLINLLKISSESCFLDYCLTKENLELLCLNHQFNELYQQYNIGKYKNFKNIFGSDYFSKHLKLIEINKITDINLASQNIIIDWIDTCGFDVDGYIFDAEENNSFFMLSIKGDVIFDVPNEVILEWADIKSNKNTNKEEFKFNRGKVLFMA